MKHSQSLVELGREQGYLTFEQINGPASPDITPVRGELLISVGN
jgi:hypothetical protein